MPSQVFRNYYFTLNQVKWFYTKKTPEGELRARAVRDRGEDRRAEADGMANPPAHRDYAGLNEFVGLRSAGRLFAIMRGA